MTTRATLRRNGKHMVTIRVTAHLDALQLAALFWHGLYEPDWKRERRSIPAARVRQAITAALLENGESCSYYVENDDDWEYDGGQDWAIDQVMRAYGFTEADLDPADSARRMHPRVGERIVNVCRGQYSYGHHGVVTAVVPGGERYVKYDDDTTQKVPGAWLAREIND